MKAYFKKYHGLGNDYIVIDPNTFGGEPTAEQIRLICDRHFGIGADGMLYGPIRQGKNLKVRIFNPDGSEAEKSGNGLRIFAKYLFEKGYAREKSFDIETLGGVVRAELKDESAGLIKIEMGKVIFNSKLIPATGSEREIVNEPLEIAGEIYKVTCCSIGNPHCVIPLEQISPEKAKQLGPLVENHEIFPNRTNVQLLKVINRNTISIEIWERGAGYTLASGSSSCAAACAARRLGLVDNEVIVKMPGGELSIAISDDYAVHMTGPVENVFEGSFGPDLFERWVS